MTQITDVVKEHDSYDLFIGAMGYEERTSTAASYLVKRGVHTSGAILLEFDMYFEATEFQREVYNKALVKLTRRQPYRLLNAPLRTPHQGFAEQLGHLIQLYAGNHKPRILFDCTSCPSIIHSECLYVLLRLKCDLTILYTEADTYYPTKEEWEEGNHQSGTHRVRGPFAGVEYVAKPSLLQGDDVAKHPLLLVLFPTFNTERTDGVLAELDPATRIWLFGIPHDSINNGYRVEMAKSFSANIMCPGDEWSTLSTFNYKETLLILGSIYADYRYSHRMAVMPHGSKMQTFGSNLFAIVHDLSMVFAMPRSYNPSRYSKGHIAVWAIHIGDTEELTREMRANRVTGRIMNRK